MEKPRSKSPLQMVLAVILLVAFLVTPVEFAITRTTVARIEHSEWLLEMASVSMDYHPEQIVDGLNRSYIQILHSVCYVFGNSMAVARQFQNVLWAMSLFFGYLTLRRLLTGGRIATLVLAVCVAAAWLCPEEVYQLRAVALLVFAISVVVWLVVGTITGIVRGHAGSGEKAKTKKARKKPQTMEETGEKESSTDKEESPVAVSQTEQEESDWKWEIPEPDEPVKPMIKQIPNVLPEPKKHVKREAVDFASQIPEESMHFDLDDDFDDDFDLK